MAHATPHTAPQHLPVVDIVAEGAKLQEAMARRTLESQLARALEGGGDTGQNSVVTAARADAEEEAGRGGTNDAARLDAKVEAGQGDAVSAARPDTGGETGGGAQERPADRVEEETLVFEPSRAEGEGVIEDMAQEAPGVEGAPISEPTEARDEGTVAVVPAPTAQGSAAAVVELPDSSEYGDSMDIDQFASASAGVLEAGMSEGPITGRSSRLGPPRSFSARSKRRRRPRTRR